MKQRFSIFSLMVVLTVGVSGLRAAEDWPKWMGPRGDGISSETVTKAWGREGPRPVWHREAGIGHGSPVIVDGTLYLFSLPGGKGGKETLSALDAKTNKVIWSQSYAPGWYASYEGTRCTPTVDGDRIYTLGEAGHLVCWKRADGKPAWDVDVLKAAGARHLDWGAASSPTIVGNLIYVQTGEGGSIAVAVDKKSGKVAWKSQATGKAGFATIINADLKGGAALLVFGAANLYAMAPDTGKTLWQVPWPTQYDVNAATPLYHDGKVLITSEYNTSKGAQFKISRKGAEKTWESKDVRSKFQPPLLDDGYVYSNSSGTITCVRWEDGKTMWEAKNDPSMRLGAGGSLLRLQEGKMIAVSERGKLLLLEAGPKAPPKVLATADLFEGDKNWATPVLYDGKLYVKGMEELVCLDLGGK